MHRGLIGVLTLLILAMPSGPAVSSQTKWRVHQTLKFDSEPLDMVVASKSQRVYILNKQGEIEVYAFSGRLKGKIDVGPDVFQIKAGAREDLLFVLKRDSKTMQAITIDVPENIDIQGSPFKGASTAPVTVAVFSDFQ
ncbi:MAG: hypothetical protein PVJ84_00725 [Desulfobacteraceae bacterium]|jgi:hypothetical protein